MAERPIRASSPRLRAMGARLARVLAGMALAAAFAISGAAAQGLGLGLGGAGDDKPLEVFADDGIEWHQNDSTYIARGNARAVKGETTVFGDTLTARYRKAANGGTEIWRVEANGNVRIATPSEAAFGDRAVFTVDDSVLVMTGKNLRLDTPRERITARDSLEYWERKNLAVARGNAVVATEDRRIRADVLSAQFKEAGASGAKQVSGKAPAKPTQKRASQRKPASAKPKPAQGSAVGAESRLDRVDAYGNVVITTPEEVARGSRGVYMTETGIATLTGSVKITRGKNQLNGETAEVNLRTGVSRIVSAKPGTGGPGTGGPVRALIMPERKADNGAGNSAASPETPQSAAPGAGPSGARPSGN